MKDDSVNNIINVEDIECPICMDIFVDPIPFPNCGHIFNRSCIQKILDKDQHYIQCPVCTKPYDFKNVNLNLIDSDINTIERVKLWRKQLKEEERKNVKKVGLGELELYSGSDNGLLCSWGKGTDGQLGFAKAIDRFKPSNINNINGILMVSCGRAHTLALSYNGYVYSWGLNNFGQTGRTKPSKVPLQVDALGGSIIRYIASGESFNLALSDDGKVYSWGEGGYGQLGRTIKLNEPNPIYDLSPLVIKFIACGHHYSAAISEVGNIYTFGRGEQGQLGHGKNESENKPKLVQALFGKRAFSIACGLSHTVAVTNDGVYVWGDGSSGKLGLGNKKSFSTPTKLSFFEKFNISQVSCGSDHTLLLTDDGNIFSWGSNAYGELGLEKKIKTKNVPTKISTPKRMRKIFAGNNYSMSISEDGELYAWGKLNFVSGHDADPNIVPGIEKNVLQVSGGSTHYVAVLGFKKVNTFLTLLNNSMFSDVKFVVEGKEIYSHKSILELRGSQFFNLFDKSKDIIQIDGINYNYIMMLFSYFYTDEVPGLTHHDSLKLSDLAQRFNLERLESICKAIYSRAEVNYVLPSTIYQEVEGLFDKDLYSDFNITFPLENKKIKAHRTVLYSRNYYFKKMFDSGMNESKGDMVVEEYPYNILFLIIKYIYQRNINITGDDVIELYSCAHKYRENTVVQECENFISNNIDEEILILVLQLSQTYQSNLLRNAAFNYLKTHKNCYDNLCENKLYDSNLPRHILSEIETICCQQRTYVGTKRSYDYVLADAKDTDYNGVGDYYEYEYYDDEVIDDDTTGQVRKVDSNSDYFY